MAQIKPFKALRPHIEYASQVASKPYDVLNTEEARKEVEGNPISFLHVTKAEVDLPADVDTHSNAVYEKAKENLQATTPPSRDSCLSRRRGRKIHFTKPFPPSFQLCKLTGKSSSRILRAFPQPF